jgi:quercetin dioxygenase-like cupin family protein
MSDANERLREHPAPRFATAQHSFDLAGEIALLRKEFPAGEQGHRQRTLYKHGRTTLALFLFERLTHLPTHRANGVVIIQALHGHLQLTANGQAHQLRADQILALAPQVEHQVIAYEESGMLLTVVLEPNPSHA